MIGPSFAVMSCALLSVTQEVIEYPGAALTNIGDELVVDGAPQRIAYFVTRDSVETVAEHFYRTWMAEGLITLVDGDVEQVLIVSAFSTLEAVQRSVVLRSQGRTTIGFSVLRSLRFERAPPILQTVIGENPSSEGEPR